MRIIKLREFLSMPVGTLYSKYRHTVFDELQIKGESLANDFFYQDIVGAIDSRGDWDLSAKLHAAAETGISLPMDFNCQGRDGCFDPDSQMFAVWERQDVEALIERLKETLV